MEKTIILFGCVVGFSMLSGSFAFAQDWQSGKRLAETWCQECHLPKDASQATDAAPPFSSIVNQPEYTDQRLRVWLADPHPPMPNLNLSTLEIENIIAYLKKLRK